MTLRKRIVRILRPTVSFVAAGIALVGLVMALLLVMFPSLSYGQEYRLAIGPDGNYVRVLELPHVRCPMPANSPGAIGGCYTQHVIMGYGNDLLARQHELEHVAGMKHGNWYSAGNGDKCAPIIAAGHTRWTVGMLMCRRQDNVGDYYEVRP